MMILNVFEDFLYLKKTLDLLQPILYHNYDSLLMYNFFQSSYFYYVFSNFLKDQSYPKN